MKIKGMWTDGKPNQQPDDTTRINKNIVVTDKLGTVSNEKGFTVLASLTYPEIGKIILDKNDFVVFSTNGSISEIGLVSNGVYSIIINDSPFTRKLGFSFAKPIHGEFFINNEGERIITWTDNQNTLRSLNIDTINQTVAQLNSFNYYTIPSIISTVNSTGNLLSGSYQPFLAYVAKDGSITDYIKKYNPIYIYNSITTGDYTQITGSESGLLTNKSIELDFYNLDSNYEKLRVGFVYTVKGVQHVYRIKDIDITKVSSIVITGNETLTEIGTNEILINKANFKTVEHITSFEDKLYCENITINQEPNLQELVDSLQFGWYSEPVHMIVNVGAGFASPQNYKQNQYNNQKKSFQHDEVYALYFRAKWDWGYGRWWNCKGRTPSDSEQASADAGITGSGDYQKFQVTDTCTITSHTGESYTGTFSAWQNQTDQNTHFKFPSLNWMRANCYDDPLYGTKYLDALGIQLAPFNLDSFIDADGKTAIGYEIGYAKRSSSRVVSQSIWIPSVVTNGNGQLLDGHVSVGGNWRDGITAYNGTTFFRTYPFDLLRDKLSKIINFVRVEYKLSAPATIAKYIDQTNGNSNLITVGVTDYVLNGNTVKSSGVLTKVLDSRYIPNDVITNDYNNTYLEEFFALKFQTQPIDTIATIPNIDGFTGTITENNALLTLLNIEKDYYLDLYNQTIINCDVPTTIDNRITFFGGDVFLCDSSINAYGINFTKYTNDFSLYTSQENTFNYKNNGTRTTKRFLFESQYNVNLRYINPKFELQTSFYPKAANQVAATTSGYLKAITKDVNPNDFVNGYEVDMHTSNSLEFSDIFNPVTIYPTVYPFRLAVSEKLNNTLNVDYNSWRDFKIANFYELERNHGRVVNLEADKDKLYIHYKNSLYVTKPRSILQAVDGVPIQLGYGDILEFAPVPIRHSELGELGTSHKWSCLLTANGYTFFDTDKGIWFLVSESVEAISSKGLYNFFKNNKLCYGDNPYTGYGFFTSYDEYYNRLLITKKNKKLPQSMASNYKGIWRDDQTFLNNLNTGDIVFKDGKYKTVR